MKQFVMSMYVTKEDLYKAKAEYWEAVARRCMEHMTDVDDLFRGVDVEYKRTDDYYWEASGDALDEGL